MPIKFAKSKERTEGEAGSYNVVPDKMYAVNGFEFLVKEGEEPCFRPNVFENLVVMVKFTTVSGEEGPAISVSPAEFVAMVNAFGAVFNPKPDRIMDVDTLLEGKIEANQAGNHLSVESKGGWVKNWTVKWLHPPEDRYTVRFKNIQEHDEGEYEYKVHTMAGGEPWKFIPLVFEIAGDEDGNPSPYNGFEIQQPISDVWVEVEYDEENDELIKIEEIGEPRPAEGVNGERWLALLDYFVPEVHNHEWLRENSPLGVDELKNPQYVILDALKKSKLTVVAYCAEDKRGKFAFDLKDIKQLNKRPEKQAEPATLQTWVDLVNSVDWGQDIFKSVSPFAFTEYGETVWAAQYLKDSGPVKGWWNSANLPEAHNFDVLTEEEIGRLIKVTKERMSL